MAKPEIRVGIDIGGTFTDFVVYQPASGRLETFKLLSTPANPADAVVAGLKRILQDHGRGPEDPSLEIVHGSTVATNALLERKGARTALITTRGFRDVLQIGRQNRPALYDFFADPAPPLVPWELRFEVDERIDHKGKVLVPLDEAQVDDLLVKLGSLGLESVAVCLLFSFLHPEHEQQVGEKLRRAGLFTSLSSQVLPEYREYERTSTTVVNAYVTPVLDRYLSDLEAEASSLSPGSRLRVMQSNGGSISLATARQSGVQCILSGPAGGIVGAQQVATLASRGNGEASRVKIITLDMGGTSTDVSLVENTPGITTESIIGGCPIHIPVLDIHTIGAGGGSVATVDPGGALRVGPQSAGADPGPACYGHGGTLPTVTDANLVLGRLQADYFLDGELPLDTQAAFEVISSLGDQLGMEPIQTALGIIEVVNANMERALRVISVERGHDPQDFTLLSFGGAGGLHASDLARQLGTQRVLIPPLASTLSAFGMLASNLVKDYSQTVMLPGTSAREEIVSAMKSMNERGQSEIGAEGIPPEDIRIEGFLDVRYAGQSYELTIPLGKDILEDFHASHQAAYGYARPDAPVEIVNLRVKATGLTPAPHLSPTPPGTPDPTHALIACRHVVLPAGKELLPLYRGETISPGNRFTGPALIVRADTTILVQPGEAARVDEYHNLWLEMGIRDA